MKGSDSLLWKRILVRYSSGFMWAGRLRSSLTNCFPGISVSVQGECKEKHPSLFEFALHLTPAQLEASRIYDDKKVRLHAHDEELNKT